MRETLIKISKNKYITANNNELNTKTATDKSIKDILNGSDLRVSIELCPNREYDEDILSKTFCSFCSVTWLICNQQYDSNPENIPAILLSKKLRAEGYNVLLHLAGRNFKKYQLLNVLEIIKQAGIRNILALRGNKSSDISIDDKCDFPYASDLIAFIKAYYGDTFTLGVAGYPQKHPDSPNLDIDLFHLKNKISSGADFILTQASFDYQEFANFAKRCRRIGIRVPIVPGIFVVRSYGTLMGISKFCDVPVPKNILEIVEKLKGNEGALEEYGIYIATNLFVNILENRKYFSGIHVFSLNYLDNIKEVMIRVRLWVIIDRPLSFELINNRNCLNTRKKNAITRHIFK